MEPVYLDYAATAPLRPQAREAMLRVMDGRFGNPSSLHRWGRDARAALEDARARLAAVLGADAAEVVFTRGGTEADNLAVLGRAWTAPDAPVACSAVEHRAVLEAARAAEAEGTPLRVLPVDGDARLDLSAVASVLAERPSVVAVQWANNETGTVQPVAEAAEACRAAGVVLHVDAVQALGKLPVRVDAVGVDLLAVSAHKIGGPRGAGALFVRRGIDLAPLLHGGGQERGIRPGTEDVAAAVGLAVAAEVAEGEREAEMRRLGALRDRLQAALLASVPGLTVNAAGAERLPTHLSVLVPGAEGDLLLATLDVEGIGVSAGSACSSGSLARSHVLAAMGVAEDAGPAVRFSLGWETTAEQVERAASVFPSVVERVRALAAA